MEANHTVNIGAVTWQDMLARGVVAIIFGLLVFLWPGLTLAGFALLFSAFAIADGFLLVLQAATYRGAARWWVRMLQGLINFSAGITVIFWPGITLPYLAYIIAIYATLAGLLQIFSAIQFREASRGQLFLLLSGLLSAGLGVILVFTPLTGVPALTWPVGIYALAYGVLLAAHALMLRLWARRPAPART